VIYNTMWAIVQMYHREITELLRNWWHQVSNCSAVSWRDYRVEWLLTPSEQSWRDYRVEWLTPSEQSLSIMERLQSCWVIVDIKWAIVQLYHGEITELLSDCWHQVSTIAYLVSTITQQLCNLSMIQLNDCSVLITQLCNLSMIQLNDCSRC
jgi:hypothetical protein